MYVGAGFALGAALVGVLTIRRPQHAHVEEPAEAVA
jgi:hypothetical protein